jgi:signal peptidase II
VFERFRQLWLLPLIVAALAFALDQLSKLWVLNTLGPNELERRIQLIGSWFDLVYLRNTGVAFGLFRDIPQLFTFTSLLICAGAIYAYAYHLPNRSTWIQLSLGLVLGGALGNVLDRVRYGYVVDFIRVGWWPVFNLADSAICVGVAIMAVYLLLNEPAETTRKTPRDDTLLSSLLNQDAWQEERRDRS